MSLINWGPPIACYFLLPPLIARRVVLTRTRLVIEQIKTSSRKRCRNSKKLILLYHYHLHKNWQQKRCALYIFMRYDTCRSFGLVHVPKRINKNIRPWRFDQFYSVCKYRERTLWDKKKQQNFKISEREVSSPVTFHYIDEVVGCSVTTQGYISIVDTVLRQNTAHRLQIESRLGSL